MAITQQPVCYPFNNTITCCRKSLLSMPHTDKRDNVTCDECSAYLTRRSDPQIHMAYDKDFTCCNQSITPTTKTNQDFRLVTCDTCQHYIEMKRKQHETSTDTPDAYAKVTHATEQGMQLTLNHLPGFYYGLYCRYKAEGFTPDEALKLVCCQVAGTVRL